MPTESGFQAAMPELLAWRCSELGEMASYLGEDEAAERWFLQGLQIAPDDFYMRNALADLLLHPAFDKNEYDKLLIDLNSELETGKTDPHPQ